jgi:hypothetical protein
MGFKQIVSNDVTGRLILSEDNNTHFNCDVYGKKKPKFLEGISGFKTKRNFDDEFNSKYQSYKKSYLPTLTKLEGYFPFPSPLSAPFSNVKSAKMKDLKDKIRSLYKNEKVKALFNIDQYNNSGLSYLTSNLSKNQITKSDKNVISSLIHNHIQEKKEENKYKPDLIK